MMSLIETQDLAVGYDDRATLETLNLFLKKGEILFILGPNGSGKSALAKTIVGSLPPLRGEVCHCGKRIGYVSQGDMDGSHWPVCSLDFVRLFTKQSRKKAEDFFRRLGIPHLCQQKMGHLSGGERQKVYLARALINEPELLILDEPFRGLDLESQKHIVKMLAEMTISNQLGILLITHLSQILNRFAHHQVFLRIFQIKNKNLRSLELKAMKAEQSPC